MSDSSSSSQNGTSSGHTAPVASLSQAVLAFRHHMQLLRWSLIQGDLSTARSSFAALQGIAPSAPATAGVNMSPQVVSSGAGAFVALFRALEDGCLHEARKAFLLLLSSLRTPPPVHPRHRGRERVRPEGTLSAGCARTLSPHRPAFRRLR
jgi:hypothetical protein